MESEFEKLEIGEPVYILDHYNKTIKTVAVKARVIECLGKPDYYNAIEYRVVTSKGKEYYLLYPNSYAQLYMLTATEYIEFLKAEKAKVNEKISKLKEQNEIIDNEMHNTYMTLVEKMEKTR